MNLKIAKTRLNLVSAEIIMQSTTTKKVKKFMNRGNKNSNYAASQTFN